MSLDYSRERRAGLGTFVMDVYCPRCGEPWEIDTFHDVADERGETFAAVFAAFQSEGCGATGWVPTCERATDDGARMRADMSGALAEMLGDDVDGIAAMMEDFGAGGW